MGERFCLCRKPCSQRQNPLFVNLFPFVEFFPFVKLRSWGSPGPGMAFWSAPPSSRSSLSGLSGALFLSWGAVVSAHGALPLSS